MELHQFDGLLNHELVHFLCQNNKYYKYKNNINIEFSKKLNNHFINIMVNNDIYDEVNKMYVSDLIFLIAIYNFTDEIENYKNHKIDEFVLLELSIQTEDMNTGFCSQGQTTRLFQIVQFLYN